METPPPTATAPRRRRSRPPRRRRAKRARRGGQLTKMAAAAPVSWEDLPQELLGLVLLRLPSLADRVRLRAVCRPWRAGAQPQQLVPPLPWLALRDGSLVDLAGAPVRCASILRKGVFGYLAVDNLAFLVHDDGGCSLMNPLSGFMLHLPEVAPAVRRAIDASIFFRQSDLQKMHVKAILSSPIESTPDPLIAVLILEGFSVAISACKRHEAIDFRMSPGTTPGLPRKLHDIAFFDGKLYTLTGNEGLHAIELPAGSLSLSSGFHQCIPDDPRQLQIYNPTEHQVYYRGTGTDPEYLVLRYLAESNGRLLMIRRWMCYQQGAQLGDRDRTFRFEVFEADLTTVPGQWMKVDSLGGHAIFLGSECTKSVLASQCAGGVQEDCIYFMHRLFDNPAKEFFGPCVDPLGDSGVYNMRDGRIMPLLPQAVMADLRRKRQFLTWFFPADA